ncbi:MAG: hypothetical protein ACJ702_05135 [Nitrososphaeraceae archaeon]
MTNENNYVVRISKLTHANQLYWNRAYYAKIRRNWTRGSKLIFLSKTAALDDAFLGLGKIEVTYERSQLDPGEKKICTENNCHSKILFGTMVRFIPSVHINDAQLVTFSNMDGPALDGAHISDSDISKIERLANIMIIT